MDHAEAVLQGKEQPTEADIIEWVEEEADRMGMRGFRAEYTNLELEETFAEFPVNSSSSGEFEDFVDLENCAHLEMMGIHQEIETMKRRRSIMNANRLICARAEKRVDQELLAAGQVLKGPDEYPNSESRFRRKVVELYDLKHPVPPDAGPPSGVDVSLRLGKKLDRQIAVRLPVEATLAEVCKLLDGTCAAEDYLTQGWHKAPEENRIWKYCLRPRGQKSGDSVDWTRLLTDADYQHLLQQATKKKRGQYFQLAILTPVSRLYKHSEVLLNHTLGYAPRNKTNGRINKP